MNWALGGRAGVHPKRVTPSTLQLVMNLFPIVRVVGGNAF